MHGTNDKYVGFAVDFSTYKNQDVSVPIEASRTSTLASIRTSVSILETILARMPIVRVSIIPVALLTTVITRSVRIFL